MSEHTKGWTVEMWRSENGDNYRIQDAKDDEANANLDLIAAAPELLKVLKDIIGNYKLVAPDTGLENVSLGCQIQNLIAEAEGRE